MSTLTASRHAAPRKPQSLYRRIVETLRREIREGLYPPGRQIPTEAEILQRFNVSRITVRRALQELATEGLLIGQKGRGTFVNPSPYAIALNVLFVHASESPITYPYTHLLMEGIQQYSRAGHPFRLELLPLPEIHQQSPDDASVEELLAYDPMDGVIAMPRIRPEVLQRLADKGIPLVIVGNRRFLNAPPGVIVDSGPTSAREMGLRHLKEIGRRRIAVVGADVIGGGTAKDRIIDTMRDLSLPFDPARYEPAGWGINPGKQAALQLLSRCPDLDAIFTSDDMQALGVLQAMSDLGRRVPDDVAVMGLGNLLGDHSHSGLTTIDVRISDLGLTAARCLHRLVEKKPVEPVNLVPPRLLRRETT